MKTLYLVTGAAGYLGGEVCRQLVARGLQGRALVLPGDKTAQYIPKQIEQCVGDLCDTASLEKFFSGRARDEKSRTFFIKFKKKSHFADFLTEQTLDFVLHRLFCGLAEMDTDDIGCLADLLSDSRASGGVGCGIVHSKSSCK